MRSAPHSSIRRRKVISERLPSRSDSLTALGLLQQRREILLPDFRQGVSAVAGSLRAQWNDDRFAAGHAFDFPLQDFQLGWIDEIVGRVDCDEWRLDFLQRRIR